MREVLVDTAATCAGQPAVVVKSDAWRMVVLPASGGKIWELEYRPKAFQFLWHNSNLAPRPVRFGTAYDEVWSGGWDEIFPTDAPYVHRGVRFPDHGEFWSIQWGYELLHEANTVILHLWSVGPVTRARFDKWIRIPATDSTIQIRYRIVNQGAAFPFLFKLHPALQVNEHSRIVLPRCQFKPDPEFSTWFPVPAPAFAWPCGQKPDGSSVDLRRVESREAGKRSRSAWRSSVMYCPRAGSLPVTAVSWVIMWSCLNPATPGTGDLTSASKTVQPCTLRRGRFLRRRSP